MVAFAGRIAPHIDRLVLGINRQVGPRHGHVLEAIAGELGLDSLKLIPHFADFWLSGPLRRELAEGRLPYLPRRALDQRLEAFVRLGLVTESAAGLKAARPFRPLLVASVAAREDVVDRTWPSLATEDLLGPIRRVLAAFPDSYTVAAAHRDLEPSPNPTLRLYDGLVTLRYVRQHDHAAAWRAAGMTAEEMKILTTLWHGDRAGGTPDVMAELARKGLVEAEDLSDAGVRLRDEIEEDTDRRNSEVWSVLATDEQLGLLDALSEMPESMATPG